MVLASQWGVHICVSLCSRVRTFVRSTLRLSYKALLLVVSLSQRLPLQLRAVLAVVTKVFDYVPCIRLLCVGFGFRVQTLVHRVCLHSLSY